MDCLALDSGCLGCLALKEIPALLEFLLAQYLFVFFLLLFLGPVQLVFVPVRYLLGFVLLVGYFVDFVLVQAPFVPFLFFFFWLPSVGYFVDFVLVQTPFVPFLFFFFWLPSSYKVAVLFVRVPWQRWDEGSVSSRLPPFVSPCVSTGEPANVMCLLVFSRCDLIRQSGTWYV